MHDEFTTGLIRTPTRRALRRAGLWERVKVEKERAKDAFLGEPRDSASEQESPLIRPGSAEKSEFPNSPSTPVDPSASYDHLGEEILCHLCESDDEPTLSPHRPIGPPRHKEAYETLLDGERFAKRVHIASARNAKSHELWRRVRVDKKLWNSINFSHTCWLSVVRWIGPQT